jgi:hypothetical protein
MVTFSVNRVRVTWVTPVQAIELRAKEKLPSKTARTLWHWGVAGYVATKQYGRSILLSAEDVLSIEEIPAGRRDLTGTERPTSQTAEVKAAVKEKSRLLRGVYPDCYTKVVAYPLGGFGVEAWSDKDMIVPLGRYPVA